MRVYLDGSVIGRALYKGKDRDLLTEGSAAQAVLALVRMGLVEFVSSDWLTSELAFGDATAAAERIRAHSTVF